MFSSVHFTDMMMMTVMVMMKMKMMMMNGHVRADKLLLMMEKEKTKKEKEMRGGDSRVCVCVCVSFHDQQCIHNHMIRYYSTRCVNREQLPDRYILIDTDQNHICLCMDSTDW